MLSVEVTRSFVCSGILAVERSSLPRVTDALGTGVSLGDGGGCGSRWRCLGKWEYHTAGSSRGR